MSEVLSLDPINDVIAQLSKVVDWSLNGPQSPNRLGYFAALYLRVTAAVREKIGTGYFQDDARMEHLDAVFADRYLTAIDHYATGQNDVPPAWLMAFQQGVRSDLIIVQQLLLGMNVHINLDLAVAAVRSCPGPALAPLHDDFMKITDLLAGIVPTVIAELGSLSPLMGLLNFLDENGEIEVLNFSMNAARTASWALATHLNTLTQLEQDAEIARMNIVVQEIGNRIVSPGFILQRIVNLVHASESHDVAAIIQALNSGNPLLTLHAAAMPV